MVASDRSRAFVWEPGDFDILGSDSSLAVEQFHQLEEHNQKTRGHGGSSIADHHKPFKGDRGIQFEAKDDKGGGGDDVIEDWQAAFDAAIDDGKSPIEAEQIADAAVNEKKTAAELSNDYLNKLRSLIMSQIKDGDLSDADLRSIVRVAAGFAGGTASARKRKEVVEAATAAEVGDSIWVGFNLPLDAAQQLALNIPGAELPNVLHVTLAYLGPTSDFPIDAVERANIALANFALTFNPIEICINGVSRFEGEEGGRDCIYAPVEGDELDQLHFEICHALRSVGLYWESKHCFTPHVTLAYVPTGTDVGPLPIPYVETMIDQITLNPGGRVFEFSARPVALAPLQMAEFVEPPATIPVLPRPGSYEHPSYGTIDMTESRLDRFIDNFTRVVYQDRIPIDLEHDVKMSGAAGWMTGLIKNSDGSVDARVEWTDMGRDALKRDRYLYVSPEWYTQWTSPIDGVKHDDVLIGAALTTRPFFKPPALRSLAATEEKVDMTVDKTPAVEAAAQAPSNVFTEQQFAEMRREINELKASKLATEAVAATQATALKQASEQIESMAEAAQLKRFTDEVLGKSDANGTRWFGEVEKHVSIMTSLAKTAGEDSDVFQSYVAQNRATAEQLSKSNLFHEVGSGQAGNANMDPQAKINALATARASEKSISFREAIRQIASEQPELYREAASAATVKV